GEEAFRVRLALDPFKRRTELLLERRKVADDAVVREQTVPLFERMRVDERHRAGRGVADVGDERPRANVAGAAREFHVLERGHRRLEDLRSPVLVVAAETRSVGLAEA